MQVHLKVADALRHLPTPEGKRFIDSSSMEPLVSSCTLRAVSIPRRRTHVTRSTSSPAEPEPFATLKTKTSPSAREMCSS